MDKSRYFAQSHPIITEFNNCFIIRSPNTFSYVNLTAQGSTQERVVTIAHEQNIIGNKTHLDGIKHAETVIR